MFSLRSRLVIGVVALEVVGGGGWMLAGCSGDDNIGDAGDATPDKTTGDVADVNVVDVVDTGTGDASDGGLDGSAASAFALAEGLATCEALLGCCPGGLDSGKYDTSSCSYFLGHFGWDNSLPYDLNVYNGPHVKVDLDAGAACLAAIKTMPCGTQTPQQWSAIVAKCQLVVTGTLGANQGGCASSFECSPNNYCDPTADGGVCRPVKTQGQPCNEKIVQGANHGNPDEECTYTGSSQSGLFCDIYNHPPDAASCQPAMGTNGTCYNSVDPSIYSDYSCTSLLCGDNGCGTNASYPYASFCTNYTIKHAGGGG